MPLERHRARRYSFHASSELLRQLINSVKILSGDQSPLIR